MEVNIWGLKQRLPVELLMFDGHVVKGQVYCSADERIIDVVSAPSGFLLFLEEDDAFRLVNKSTVARIRPLEKGSPYLLTTHMGRAGVELVLTDGTVMMGKVFVSDRVRVSDVFNSDRTFFPFETEHGELEIINKQAIARATPTRRED